MPTAEALVRTDRPDRYVAQLCQHAGKMGSHLRHRPQAHGGGEAPPEIQHAECTGTDGVVVLNWGKWTMRAAPGCLTVRAEAADQESLRRIQEFVTARLEKIGRRDHLTVNWHPSDAPADEPA